MFTQTYNSLIYNVLPLILVNNGKFGSGGSELTKNCMVLYMRFIINEL